MSAKRGPFRLGRAALVLMALVANVIAAGVPVLHALAHAVEHEHEVSTSGATEADHPHDEVHPLALHDDCVLTSRTALDPGPALPHACAGMAPLGGEDTPPFHPVLPVPSRAPPGPHQARAPPYV